jgi:O-antigen/teichoic acid export membrane protein
MSNSTFGLRTFKGFIAKIVLAVIGFAGTIYFARVLGSTGYGIYGTILAAAVVLNNPITGIGDACKKRVSEVDGQIGEIISVALITAIIGGAAIAALAFGIERSIGYFDISRGTILLPFMIVCISAFVITQQVLSGTGQFGNAIISDMVRSLLTIPIQIALVTLGFGVTGMVIGISTASILLVPFMLISVGTLPAIPSQNTLIDLWEYAKFSIPTGFVGATYSRLDILLLNGVLGAAAAGEYKIAYQLVLPGTMLSGVMSSGLFAEVSEKASRNQSIDTRVTNNIAFASLVSIPLAFGAGAMPSDLLTTIFGPEYKNAHFLLIGLGLYQVVATQTAQIQSIVTGSDRPDLELVVSTITVLLNITLGFGLIYLLGAIGVVIATVLAEIFRYGSYLFIARRFTTFTIFPKPLIHQMLAGILMFVIVDPIHAWFGVRSWIDLLGFVTFGGIIYIVVLSFLSEPVLITIRSIIRDARKQYLS